jgi:hypothetical protein
VKGRRGPGGGDHFGNFIAAVRSRKVADLNADIAEGQLSAALCHLPNISYRLGEPSAFASANTPFASCETSCEAFDRMKAHLKSNNVALDGLEYRMGRTLKLDPKAETILGDAEASALLTRPYRAGFAMPENV